MDELAGLGLGERGVELRSAVLVEQAPELPGDIAEVLPALGTAMQEAAAMRCRVLQAVRAAHPLLGEDVAERPRAIFRAWARAGDPGAPVGSPGVEVVEIDVRPRGEEVVADVADPPLDPPLLVAHAGAQDFGAKR
ncbi:hypothetical protein [Nannocystis radixulma]|uniref:Uncharacterized protein n=1 Tax=Nannocystis radixulma TaxID=2995305 RepID=A0ABT5BC05_9BACT|nr:hypothetical protein [Nannocystis radixulma]MDC0670536.1 hypothetical protein [Nannocystis radixulma]